MWTPEGAGREKSSEGKDETGFGMTGTREGQSHHPASTPHAGSNTPSSSTCMTTSAGTLPSVLPYPQPSATHKNPTHPYPPPDHSSGRFTTPIVSSRESPPLVMTTPSTPAGTGACTHPHGNKLQHIPRPHVLRFHPHHRDSGPLSAPVSKRLRTALDGNPPLPPFLSLFPMVVKSANHEGY